MSLPIDNRDGAPRNNHNGALTCAFCKSGFSSTEALRNHKATKVREENHPDLVKVHIWCRFCDLDFQTLGGIGEHLRQFHAHKQHFPCPGCNIEFTKLSSFVQHIELGQCCQLNIENLKDRLTAKLNFAKGLGRLDQASRQEVRDQKRKDFSIYLGEDVDPEAPWKEDANDNTLLQSQMKHPKEQGLSGPAASASKTFAETVYSDHSVGNSKSQGLSTGDQTNPLDGKYNKNSWAGDKTTAKHGDSTSRDTSDPSSPYFDPQQCWHPILQMYKCPHKSTCKKSFNNKSALIQHLKSATHRVSSRVLTCPSCLDHFGTVFALAAHVESQSQKCNMRRALSKNDMYRIFLDQLTWGVAEVGGKHNDYTQKLEFQEGFTKVYGPQKASGPSLGHMQTHGSDSRASAQTQPQFRETAVGKQQEPQKSHPQFKSPGQQHNSSHPASGPSIALTADALKRLQLQEENTGSQFQQKRRDNSWNRPTEPQQQGNYDAWYQPTSNAWSQHPGPQQQQMHQDSQNNQNQQQGGDGIWGHPATGAWDRSSDMHRAQPSKARDGKLQQGRGSSFQPPSSGWKEH